MLNKRLIGGIVVFCALGFLGYLFYLGMVDLSEYATQLAVGISLAIVGVLYWTFKEDIERLAGRSKKSSGFLQLEDNDKVDVNKRQEEKLNDLLKEIDSFILEWKRRLGFKIGYKRQIESKEIYEDIKRFPEHARKMQHRIKSIDNIQNNKLEMTLHILKSHVDEIIQLGSDLETTFRFLKLKEAKKIPEEKITELIKRGDQICDDLKICRVELQKLRIEII